jgi:BA14K-like protein
MFKKINQLAFATAFGIASLVMADGPASAMPIISAPEFNSNESASIQLADHQMMNGGMYWQFGRDGNRCRNRIGRCRHFHEGYYYETPWWTLPLIIGNTIANGNHGRSHVQWCLSRYRSYNPHTDMWLGNSGRYYRCNSPY